MNVTPLSLQLYKDAGVPTRQFIGVPVFQAEGLTVTTRDMVGRGEWVGWVGVERGAGTGSLVPSQQEKRGVLCVYVCLEGRRGKGWTPGARRVRGCACARVCMCMRVWAGTRARAHGDWSRVAAGAHGATSARDAWYPSSAPPLLFCAAIRAAVAVLDYATPPSLPPCLYPVSNVF